MSRLDDPTIEWATGSLLDPSNVGKCVVTVWNGNTKSPDVERVVKVTRTNVHVQIHNARPDSYRVDRANQGVGAGTRSQYMISVYTREAWLERDVRAALLRRLSSASWHKLSTARLRELADELDAADPD